MFSIYGVGANITDTSDNKLQCSAITHKVVESKSGPVHKTNFTARDKTSPIPTDVNVMMMEGKGIGFKINGEDEKEHKRLGSSISKASLADTPVRMMRKDTQQWLRFKFNLAEDHLDVHYQGADVRTLEQEVNEEIH